MSLPMMRTSSDLAEQVPEGFSRSEGKTLMRVQNREPTHGLVKATRVKAAAAVGGIGLQATGMLGREARFQADGDPTTVNRMNCIVEQFAAYAGDEVGRCG